MILRATITREVHFRGHFRCWPFDRLGPRTREICHCHEWIDGILGRGDCPSDAAVDYAQHVPVRVIALLLGASGSDSDQFQHRSINRLSRGSMASAELEKSL